MAFNPGLSIGQILKNADIVCKKVGHKSFGTGVITGIDGGTIIVNFDKVGEKKMGYEVCMKNKLLQFI